MDVLISIAMKHVARVCLLALIGVACGKVSATDGPGGSGGTGAGAGAGNGGGGQGGGEQGDGSAGNGGPDALPPIAGTSLRIEPSSQMLTLSLDSSGMIVPGTATFKAIAVVGGQDRDVTSQVNWPSDLSALTVTSGVASVTAPGTFVIRASSGQLVAQAMLVASFSGSMLATGLDPAAAAALDGTPTGMQQQVTYPLDGSLIPRKLGPLTVQVSRDSLSTVARVELKADGVDVLYYDRCLTDPAHAPGPGCSVQLPPSVTDLFVPASQTGDVTLTARVEGTGGLSESAPIHVAFADSALPGALYFWTTIKAGASFPGYVPPLDAVSGTAIQRYDFAQPSPAVQLVYTDQGAPPSYTGSPFAQDSSGGDGTCVGCHAITGDGKYMAFSVNGSDASGLALYNIGARMLVPVSAPELDYPLELDVKQDCAGNPALGCGAETTFGPVGPNGELPAMINMYRSKLYLRTSDFMSMIVNQGEAAASTADPYRTDPFWSARGDLLAFTGFSMPSVGLYNTTGLNGDEKIGGQIWVATATRTMINDDAKVVVPRADGVSNFYPTISSDSTLLVFDRSTCSSATDPNHAATDYGSGACDGYDDWTANLWVTTPQPGGPVIRLDQADGLTPASNSFPRFAPAVGSFRGRPLYWLAFASRRPYGQQLNYNISPVMARPQLWVTALLGNGDTTKDPSFAPVWLPNQNLDQSMPNGNHTPEWVTAAVPFGP
jgi:hypothetical protein